MKSWSRKLPKRSAVNTAQCMLGKIDIKSYIFFVSGSKDQCQKKRSSQNTLEVYLLEIYSGIKASVNEICHAERKKAIFT